MANYKKIKNSKVSFELEVSEQDLAKSQAAVLQKYKQNLTIKGFRKGHAPEKVVVANVGIEKMAYEALDRVVSKAYSKFIETEKLAVISQPKVDMPENQKTPFKVKFEVEVFPSVDLGDYKKITVKKKEIKVTKKEVADVLETVCAQAQISNPVKRAIKAGDFIEADFEGRDDKGEVLPSTAAKNQKFRIGMGHFLKDLEDAYLGMKAGEEKKDVKVSFPKDYQAKDFAGKTILFNIKVHSVSAIEPRKLTEEQIEQLSGKKQNLEDFSKEIELTIKANKQQAEDKKAMDEFVEKLTKKAKVDLPESWILSEIKGRMDKLKSSPQYKADPEKFFKELKKSEKDLEKEFKEKGIQDLTSIVALSEAVKKEGIELDKDEITSIKAQAKTAQDADRIALNMKIDKFLKAAIV